MMLRLGLTLGAGALLLGTAQADMTTSDGSKIIAKLQDTAGVDHGMAVVKMRDGIMHITVKATGLLEGVHGMHIHAIGKCDGANFAGAGGHWNPDMKLHGHDNPMGAHRGDLPNLVVGADGRGIIKADIPAGSGELIDADGASLVIHASPDDYKTDPSGNSGARIACGVFTKA